MTAYTDLVIRKSLHLGIPAAHAFRLFTEGIDFWWPRHEHNMGPVLTQVVLEAREGDRWHERDADGVDREIGTAVAWNPRPG